jgi:hypothetical protein
MSDESIVQAQSARSSRSTLREATVAPRTGSTAIVQASGMTDSLILSQTPARALRAAASRGRLGRKDSNLEWRNQNPTRILWVRGPFKPSARICHIEA